MKLAILLIGGLKVTQRTAVAKARTPLRDYRQEPANVCRMIKMDDEIKLSPEEWEELDRALIQEGVYEVHDEIDVLEDEEIRYWTLHDAFNNEDAKYDREFQNEIKRDVKESRKRYGHPVPDDEFFGF